MALATVRVVVMSFVYMGIMGVVLSRMRIPGDVKTAFTEKRDKSICGSELYGDAISRAVGKMESDEKNGMLPEIIARSLVRLSGKKHPKPLSTVGTGYKLLFILSKLLPVRTVNYLEGRLYG